jgi:hypothetical protein
MSTTNVQTRHIKDLTINDFRITTPKKDTNGINAAILDDKTGKPMYIETDKITVIYPPSDYNGNGKYSITFKNITNDEDSKNNVDKLFNDVFKKLNEKGLDYIIDHKDILFKEKDAKNMTRELAETPAFFGACISKDSRDEDQARFQIGKKYNTDLPDIVLQIEKVIDSGDGKTKTINKQIKWTDCEDPWQELKNSIKPGMHMQCLFQPRIYFINTKMGFTFKLRAIKVTKTSKSAMDTEVKDLDIDHFGFSEPKPDKNGRLSSIVLNTKNKTTSGKFIGGYHRCKYGISKYEQQNSGVCEYSLYVDNQTDIPQETEAVQNFMDFSAQLYDKVIDFILEYKDELFKKSEAKKMTRKLAESAYSNNIISNDKEGNDQIKLKITKTRDDQLPNFTLIEEIMGDNKEIQRNEIEWSSYDEPWEELRKIVRAGMHVKPIIQPRIYIVNNKVGISYILNELIVRKSQMNQFDPSAFTFSGSSDTQNDDDEEEDVVEEEEEEDSETSEKKEKNDNDSDSEVIIADEEDDADDPDAYGIESDED